MSRGPPTRRPWIPPRRDLPRRRPRADRRVLRPSPRSGAKRPLRRDRRQLGVRDRPRRPAEPPGLAAALAALRGREPLLRRRGHHLQQSRRTRPCRRSPTGSTSPAIRCSPPASCSCSFAPGGLQRPQGCSRRRSSPRLRALPVGVDRRRRSSTAAAPARERAVNAGYPSMDIVLLAGLAGFFVTAAWRTPAFLLLVASITTLLVSDEIYGSSHVSRRRLDRPRLAAQLHPLGDRGASSLDDARSPRCIAAGSRR